MCLISNITLFINIFVSNIVVTFRVNLFTKYIYKEKKEALLYAVPPIFILEYSSNSKN